MRAIGLRRGIANARDNQVPLQALAEGLAIPVNPAGLTDAEVRASLAQMAQAITMQAQAMIAQVNRQNVQRENPPVRNMADRLRDLTRMNPPIFTEYRISEYPQEFMDEGAEDLKEECRAAMLHDNICLSRIMVHVQQVEESRKRKHTKVGNRSSQVVDKFSRKSSTEIRDKTKFKKGPFHQRESNSSKGRYDRDSGSRVKRNNEVDTPQERPPCWKYGKLNGGECMMDTNTCYSCGKLGHMVKDCPNQKSQEQGKERTHLNGSSEEAPRRQQFFALKYRGAGEGTSGEVSCEYP
nr:uncharacterized protein LOC101256381 [Solanum lycopersicum]